MFGLNAFSTILVLLAAGFAIWAVGRVLINRKAGLQGRLRVATGPVVRTSPWGSADVNGVGFMECVRVLECQDGWLVQLHWLLGGGKLWLPRSKTEIIGPDIADRSLADKAVLHSGPQHIRLEGELAEFIVAKSAPRDS